MLQHLEDVAPRTQPKQTIFLELGGVEDLRHCLRQQLDHVTRLRVGSVHRVEGTIGIRGGRLHLRLQESDESHHEAPAVIPTLQTCIAPEIPTNQLTASFRRIKAAHSVTQLLVQFWAHHHLDVSNQRSHPRSQNLVQCTSMISSHHLVLRRGLDLSLFDCCVLPALSL